MSKVAAQRTVMVAKGFVVLSLLVMCVRPAFAQVGPDTKIDPAFALLAKAGELANSSVSLTVASQDGATLTQKRKAVADPAVIDALDSLHAWLETPLVLTDLPDPTMDRNYPRVTTIMALGDALATRMYVLLADGRVADAIETMRDGLRLSAASGATTLGGWQVGTVLQQKLIYALGSHLDQLSVQDCNRLYRLALDWTQAPDALTTLIERSRRWHANAVQKLLTPAGYDAVVKELAGATSPETVEMSSQLSAMGPQALQQLVDGAVKTINLRSEQVVLALQTPYWKQLQIVSASGDSAAPTDELTKELVGTSDAQFVRWIDRATELLAKKRLLGCHAAIRLYRWEHNRLPSSLAELKLGDLGVDPFTGKPFPYKTNGVGFDLGSVGPSARDDSGTPSKDRHLAITLMTQH